MDSPELQDDPAPGAPPVDADADRVLIDAIFARAAGDLSMICDRPLAIEDTRVERVEAKPAAEGTIHISFKLGFQRGSGNAFGCLLVPLPDALSLAGYLMMLPDDAVAARRDTSQLERSDKDAMLEVGNFVAGATDAVLRRLFPEGPVARSEGCQGIRPLQRPGFPYEVGDELLVGRSRMRLGDFAPFEATLVLPAAFFEG